MGAWSICGSMVVAELDQDIVVGPHLCGELRPEACGDEGPAAAATPGAVRVGGGGVTGDEDSGSLAPGGTGQEQTDNAVSIYSEG